MAAVVYPTTVVAYGRDRADAVAQAALTTPECELADTPRRTRSGWWGVALTAPSPVPEQVITAIRAGGSAGLIVQYSSAPVWFLSLIDSERSIDASIGLEAVGHPEGFYEAAASICRWAEGRVPKPPTIDACAAVLRRTCGWSGDEASLSLFRYLGLTVKHAREPWQLLRGATADWPTARVVGLQWIDPRKHRYVLAQGRDFFGVWDLDRAGDPAERWPLTKAGRQAAQQRHFELVERPILESTTLLGDRRWTRWHSPGTGAVFGALLHWSEAGDMALIKCLAHPRTAVLESAPSARVHRAHADRVGWSPGECVPAEPPFSLDYRVAMSTLSQAERVATFNMAGNQVGRWNEVPERVSRALLDTIEWVRSRVSETPSSSG